jgi:hypothetical protein
MSYQPNPLSSKKMSSSEKDTNHLRQSENKMVVGLTEISGNPVCRIIQAIDAGENGEVYPPTIPTEASDPHSSNTNPMEICRKKAIRKRRKRKVMMSRRRRTTPEVILIRPPETTNLRRSPSTSHPRASRATGASAPLHSAPPVTTTPCPIQAATKSHHFQNDFLVQAG